MLRILLILDILQLVQLVLDMDAGLALLPLIHCTVVKKSRRASVDKPQRIHHDSVEVTVLFRTIQMFPSVNSRRE